MKNPDQIIKLLNLSPHPEGGYYNEIIRSSSKINDRSLFTSIYYLLCQNDFSAFHSLKSDEIWHFYDGTTLLIHIFTPDNNYKLIRLGNDINKNEVYQYCIKSGSIFAAEVENKNSFSLVGCTVSPGFEFSDLIIHNKNDLIKKFPEHKSLIIHLTRP